MLPAAPSVLLARQGFADAQAGMVGAKSSLGFFTVGWYGTNTDDERGSFAIVNPAGPLFKNIGDFLNIRYERREVYVYVIGSQNALLTDLAVTRRAYMAVARLALDPVRAKVSLVA